MKTIYLKTVFILLVFASTACSAQNSTETDSTISVKVKELIKDATNDEEKAEAIFYFMRDSVKFDWVYPQEISAEEVLKNRKGVCMQKTNLFVAMAREAGLKARFHFMYVEKTALQDFLPDFAYKKWVSPFPHTFPELFLNGQWVSMEATIDKELHEICIAEKKNFGRNPEIVQQVSIDFSPNGVKGHQQYVQNTEKQSFYGDDLSEFTEYLHNDVPKWKLKMQPMIFKNADKLINELRNSKN
jgi:hypothetical protein